MINTILIAFASVILWGIGAFVAASLVIDQKYSAFNMVVTTAMGFITMVGGWALISLLVSIKNGGIVWVGF